MKSGILLGIDYGERRIGLALSDPDGIVARGYATLDTRRTPDTIGEIARIVEAENVQGLVVGYPQRTDGRPGGKTEVVDAFISELAAVLPQPIHREDESFSSVWAQEALRARGGRTKKKRRRESKEAIDRLAACRILQDFLDRGEKP